MRALRYGANWSYNKLHGEFNIPLSTLHRIIHGVKTLPGESTYHSCGRYRNINVEVKQRLIETATANSHNRRLPLTRVAELV